MTAPLPVPQDAHPNQPDAALGAARRLSAPVLPPPPKPEVPAEVAAAGGSAASGGSHSVTAPAPRVEPKSTKPRAKRQPRKARASEPASPPAAPAAPAQPVAAPVSPVGSAASADSAAAPGSAPPPLPPLPSLPADLVIPPRPPLPARTVGEPDSRPGPESQPDPESQPEPEPQPEPESQPEPEPVAPPATGGERAAEATAAASVDPAPAIADTDLDPDTAALVVKGVRKSFGGTRAVDGIDLTVPAGTFYGLVGPNGAGKTTTLSVIAGLLRPDRGTIRVNGIDAVTDPVGAKRQMGVLPDRLRIFDRLTGRQLLHYYGALRGLPSSVVESRTADLARAFDLTEALGRVVSDYSAGMVKKVMLAGALIHSPRLLVLDEPFEAVDPVSSAIILDILSAYVAHGGTVILSSHGMDLVERHCSRVAVLVAGQVLAEGTVEEVRGELTLEQRFIELAGGLSDVEGLEWLHTFSG